MQNNLEQIIRIDHAKIGVLAYQLWEQAGHPSGRDKEFWFQAEAELRAALKATPAPQAAKPSLANPLRVTLPAPTPRQAVRPLGLPGSSTARRNHHSAPRMGTRRPLSSPRN
jgi:DUF2934 family protein